MYRALVSFSGLISMMEGEVRDIADKDIVKDLLNARYIEEANPPKKEEPKEEPKEEAKEEPKPKRKRGGKKK